MTWLARHRLFAFAAICAFWAAIILVGHFYPALPFLSALGRGELAFEDLLQREGPQDCHSR